MKYFRQVQTGVPTQPFLTELAAVAQPRSARRTAPQREALLLRRARTSPSEDRARCDEHDSRWTYGSHKLRLACNFLKSFVAERGVDLGRARLMRIPAHHHVRPHVDTGDYYLFRDRYHLVLQAPAGIWSQSGDEQVIMREGELWWFNNKAVHEGWNGAASDCILLAFDVLNADGKRLLAHAERTRARREGVSAPAQI